MLPSISLLTDRPSLGLTALKAALLSSGLVKDTWPMKRPPDIQSSTWEKQPEILVGDRCAAIRPTELVLLWLRSRKDRWC